MTSRSPCVPEPDTAGAVRRRPSGVAVTLPREASARTPTLPGSSTHRIRSCGETAGSHATASSPTPRSRSARGPCSTARRRCSAGVAEKTMLDALRSLTSVHVVSSPRVVAHTVRSHRRGTVRKNPRSQSRTEPRHRTPTGIALHVQFRISGMSCPNVLMYCLCSISFALSCCCSAVPAAPVCGRRSMASITR